MSDPVYSGTQGRYRLSVINRDYETQEGTFTGPESAILEAVLRSFKVVWIDGYDWSNYFKAMESEQDVRDFMERYGMGIGHESLKVSQ